MTNCPNCGAPLTGHKCQYCGSIIFDFAAIEIGKPVWINFKLGERWVLAHVLPESASMHVEPMDEVVMYADGAAQATFMKPAPVRIEMDFIEIPTDKGYGHIVSERGIVPSPEEAAISAICNACGKIDCDKMDKCEKLQLPPANNSEIPNSSDTISRQAAIDGLRDYLVGKRCPDDGTLTCRLIENEVINKLQPIQPEIVRCKDCKNYKFGMCLYSMTSGVGKLPNGFCDWAERREVNHESN